ncbi:hypothetical protein [Paracoccus methylarcula]|uniref:Uncharacterized protein n=1 Tax=Paracoccus methylarcula TaxID=72022 RepID=A0A3R7NWN2_9RHOB|nr:hypothetical protein [Paracoccus methylarcula]RNF33712.1 hypothetical protein A7A09_014575 [Paracoccus methylarcula]
MTERTATLREITDALATARGMSTDEHERLYSRARTMRDRGLIFTRLPRSQGRETKYAEGDICAAVTAISMSLAGTSQDVIAAMLGQLRTFGPRGEIHACGTPAFEDHLAAIRSGAPVFVRFDVVHLGDDSGRWPGTHSRMGSLASLGLEEEFERTDAYGATYRIEKSDLIPVTLHCKPVLDILAED